MKYPSRIPKQLPPHVARKRDGDCPQHRAFVRQQKCLFHGPDCAGPKHAHHVRNADNSGVGVKPHDRFCVPLCAWHHTSGHNAGWGEMEYAYNIDMLAEAEKLAKRSPALKIKEG